MDGEGVRFWQGFALGAVIAFTAVVVGLVAIPAVEVASASPEPYDQHPEPLRP